MDRNTIIGLVLIVAILFGYQWYTAPTPEQKAAFARTQDSLANVAAQQAETRAAQDAARAQSAAATPAVAAAGSTIALPDTGATADSLRLAALRDSFGIFSAAATGANKGFVLENEHIEVTLNSFGARPGLMRLKEYTTYGATDADRKPLLLAVPDSGSFGYEFFLGNLRIHTRNLHFTGEQTGPLAVRFTAPTEDPARFLAIHYTLDSASWFLDVRAELVGLAEVHPRTVMFHWDLLGFNNEKHLLGERQKSTVYFKYQNDDRDYLSESKTEKKKLDARTNWVAFKQDFFTVAMVSEQGFTSNGSEIAVHVDENSTAYNKRYEAKLFFDQEASARVDLPMRLYLGPNHYNTLRRTEIPQFDRIIDLGWGIFGWMNRFVVIPIFNFFGGFNLSYGIIILLLTVAIKLILLPVAFKNQKSSARMKALRPEIEAINKKFPSDEPMKRQQATMDLYRKAGVSPMAGCVPMLIQMPILFAMFRFFPSSIELRQQPFLWADDLSSYDSILSLPFSIPAYGSHVSLFTLLMAASTILFTLINSKQMPSQQSMPGMKTMMYIFPVMMLFFMNSLPAGLSYYYLLSNVISILQMTVISKWIIDEPKLRAELLGNMKQPRKKSKWQQRLEDMQKQQQAAQKARRR